LPQSRTDGYQNHADIPQMLLMTGGCDDLGCFMKNMGLADSEFSAPHGGGRLDVYQGAPAGLAIILGGAPATLTNGRQGLWGSPVFTKQNYEYYDIAIFSCECSEHQEAGGSDGGTPGTAGFVVAPGRQALHDWLNEGGK